MGYYSSLSGSFEITPVPRMSDFDLTKLQREEEKERRWGLECIKVEFDRISTSETEDDGTEVLRTRVVSARINACNESDHKHYHVIETLQAIVDMLGKDRQYKGYFECHGEDSDQWRYSIVNGVAQEFKPVITWPDEAS